MMDKKDVLKDYITVNERILKFYEQYPDGRIITSIVSWAEGRIVMQATIYRDHETEKALSIGHAYEQEGSTYINKTSALENCETSAVGRALALAGFEIKKSIASREEVEAAQAKQEQLKKEEAAEVPEIIKELYLEKFGNMDNFDLNIQKLKERGFTFEEIYQRLEGKK
jgi:hypothetical protein